MAFEISDEERRSEYISKLGQLTGSLFWAVYEDFVVLKLEWRIFSELFRAYEERIDVLNRASGTTALVLQNALRERVIVKLCRLMDPARQGKNKNASLEALFQSTEISEHAINILTDARADADHFRDLRNKSIAHRDMGHATLETAFSGVSYQDIDQRTKLIGLAIKVFAEEKLNTTLLLNVTSGYSSDEVSFINTLSLGLDRRKEISLERERLIAARDFDQVDHLDNQPVWLRDRKFDVLE